MIKLEKKESIYFLTMNAEENRWNTTFVREISEALDEIKTMQLILKRQITAAVEMELED